VHQGNPGDKYFLPAISALARFPNRIKTVFHFTTALHQACIYRLIVKVSGEIQEIVIDDYVPVYSDSGRPVFCKSNGEEVWVMLIEKAWAKLKGSYGAILKGCPHEVLSTFCLGPCRSYDLTTRAKESFSHIWEDLKQAYCRHFTVCATSNSAPRQPLLEPSSVYAILGVSE
jgi:calpain-15